MLELWSSWWSIQLFAWWCGWSSVTNHEMSYRATHSFLRMVDFQQDWCVFSHRNCLNWMICCRMMYLHLNLSKRWTFGLNHPNLSLTLDAVITGRDDVVQYCGIWDSSRRTSVLFSSVIELVDLLIFITVLDCAVYDHLWRWGDCGHQLSAIGLHRLFLYLAFLHYMVCWWFQRHMTHWGLLRCY